MTKELESLIDEFAGPLPIGWSPDVFIRLHIAQLLELREILEARIERMEEVRREKRLLHQIEYYLRTWCSMVNESEDQRVDIDAEKSMDRLDEFISAYRMSLLDEGGRAIGWAVSMGDRRSANKIAFHLNAELERVEEAAYR